MISCMEIAQVHEPIEPIGISEPRAVDRVLRAALHATERESKIRRTRLALAITWLRKGYGV